MPVNKAGYRSFAVDAANAVEWDNPLNRSLAFWYYNPPGVASAGGRWLNLCDARSQLLFIPGCGFGQSRIGPALSLPDSAHSLAAAKLGSGLTNSEVTISGWGINVNFASVNQRFISTVGAISTTRGCTLAINSSGNMRFLVGNGTALNTATINPTAAVVGKYFRWYGVTRNTAGSTFSASLFEFVEGGSSYPTITTTTGISGSLTQPTTYPIFIGNSQGTDDSSTTTVATFAAWRGFVGDVKGWNRALSIDEIQADFRQSSRQYQTNDSPLRWFSTRAYSLPGGSSGDGSSAGTSTVSGVGSASVAGVGLSTGASTVAASGQASSASAGSTAGTGIASAIGRSSFAAFGTVAGIAVATGIGGSLSGASGFGASVGSAIVTGIASSSYASVGSVAAIAVATGLGLSLVRAIGSIFGTSTVTGISSNAGAGNEALGGGVIRKDTSLIHRVLRKDNSTIRRVFRINRNKP